MKTVKKGTIKSKIKRGDQVVFISGREYNRLTAPATGSRFAEK
jgi:acid phosphatase class B